MRPWSHTRLGTYDECPRQYQYSYIERLTGFRPESPAANRGIGIHEKAEGYLLGNLPMYPPELQKVAAHTMMLKAKKAEPEKRLGVKEDWSPCDYADPDAYFRIVIDILYFENKVCHIQDWKSGQVYDKHNSQLEEYTAVAAAHYPDLDYSMRLIYVDQGFLTKPRVVAANRVKPIRIMIDGRIKIAESDKIYPTRAGQHCKWCDYSARYGGPCKY